MEEPADAGANRLADHRGDRSARRAHGGQAQPAEDEDGIEDDVRHGADHLRPHGEPGLTRGLEQPLHADLQIDEEGADGHDLQIGIGIAADALDIRLGVDEGFGQEDAEKRHQRPAAEGEENRRAADAPGLFRIPAAQGAGHQCAHAHARAGAQADQDILGREGQGQGRETVLRHLSHIDAVHHVIQRLDEHGEHHRHRHLQQELSLRHLAHAPGIQSFCICHVFCLLCYMPGYYTGIQPSLQAQKSLFSPQKTGSTT